MCVCVCVCWSWQADENFVAPTMEFREVYGVAFSQRRNDALFTPAHLAKVRSDAPQRCSVCKPVFHHVALLLVFLPSR